MTAQKSLNDLESEKALIGTILFNGELPLELNLKPEYFFQSLHQRIYKSILHLDEKKVKIDPISVITNLKEYSLFESEERESDYIYELYKEVIPTQTLFYYADKIKTLSQRRDYEKILLNSIEFLRDEPGENDPIFYKIEKDLTNISHQLESKGLKPIADDKESLVEYIENLVKYQGQINGLRTDFYQLDELTTGLKEYELMILAARPGYGKTTFALNIASNVCLKQNKTVVIFSLEMGRMELETKMICSHASIELHKLKRAEINDKEKERFLESIVSLTNAPLYIDDSATLSTDEFKGKVRKLSLKDNNLGLIIVDYLQLMNDKAFQGTGGTNRTQEVSSISRTLKSIAKEVGCPVLALSQLNRAIESRTRGENRPQLSDLRESGAIEQDADIVSFIYNEELAKKGDVDEDKKGKVEIIIAKNRSGPVGNFSLSFRPELSRFDNI